MLNQYTSNKMNVLKKKTQQIIIWKKKTSDQPGVICRACSDVTSVLFCRLINVDILWLFLTIQMLYHWTVRQDTRRPVDQIHVQIIKYIYKKHKRKRSDSVLWQKPIHQQKCQKGKVTTQTTQQKNFSITQQLRTDLGRSVGVTTATQLMWLTWFTGPTFPLPATAVLSKGHTFKNL